MEAAVVFLVFTGVFVEVFGKGGFVDDPWTPLVERFNEIMKGIEENNFKKGIMESVLIKSIMELVSTDCKNDLIKEVAGPWATNIPGVLTKLYVRSHPMDQMEEQSFWILPSVECGAKNQGNVVGIPNSRPTTSVYHGVNQPITNRNPTSNPHTSQTPGNPVSSASAPIDYSKYVLVQMPDKTPPMIAVATPYYPTKPKVGQPGKSTQEKPSPPPGRGNTFHKERPNMQQNPLHENGKENTKYSPTRLSEPLKGGKDNSWLTGKDREDTYPWGARPQPYDHVPHRESYPNTPKTKLKPENHGYSFGEPYYPQIPLRFNPGALNGEPKRNPINGPESPIQQKPPLRPILKPSLKRIPPFNRDHGQLWNRESPKLDKTPKKKVRFSDQDPQAVKTNQHTADSAEKQNSEENDSSDVADSGLEDSSSADIIGSSRIGKPGYQRRPNQHAGKAPLPKPRPLKPFLATDEDIDSYIARHHKRWDDQAKNLE